MFQPSTIARCFVMATVLVFAISAQAQEKPSVNELVKQLSSEDVEARRDAAHGLAHYGPQAKVAVPALAKALGDRDTQVWHEATQALAYLGPDAIEALDALIDNMGSRDEQRRYRTAFALGSIGIDALPAIRETLADESAGVRETAVRAIGWMRSDAADTVPDLVKRLDDDEEVVRACAVESLARIGSAATNELIAALQQDTSRLRAGASKTLALIGHEASEATDALLKLCRHIDDDVRASAILALGRINPTTPQVVDSFVGAIDDPAKVVQQAALESLVRTAPSMQESTATTLASKLGDADEPLAMRISLVLGSFGSNSATSAPQLIDALKRFPNLSELPYAIGRVGASAVDAMFDSLRSGQINIEQATHIIDGMPANVREQLAGRVNDDSSIVREVSMLTVGKVVPLPRNTIDLLKTGLQDSEASVRRAAAGTLLQVGAKSKAALPELIAASSCERDASARVAMIRAVGALHNSDGDELVDFLAGNLNAGNPQVRIVALSRLGDMEELPVSLHGALTQQVGDSNEEVRSGAIRAVVRVQKQRDLTSDLVVAALGDESELVREQALLAAAELGDAATAAVGVISEQLKSDSGNVRIAAIESLARIGKNASAAFESISKLSSDSSSTVRMTVMKSLPEIDTEPERLLPVLIKGVEDDEWEVRRTAASELGDLEEAAAPAIPALLRMLRADDDSDAARRAIREINTAGEDAVPLLLEILQDENAGRRSRYYAVYLLRKMGVRAKSALPLLRQLLEESDGRERESYERAIDEIEEAVEDAE